MKQIMASTTLYALIMGGSNAISRHDLHNFALRLIRELRAQMGGDTIIYGVNIKFSRAASKYDEVVARECSVHMEA